MRKKTHLLNKNYAFVANLVKFQNSQTVKQPVSALYAGLNWLMLLAKDNWLINQRHKVWLIELLMGFYKNPLAISQAASIFCIIQKPISQTCGVFE